VSVRAEAQAAWRLGRGPLRAGLPGLLDQALIAGCGFAATVVLGRGLGPAAFGAYVLAYAALQYAWSLQTALVTQPHNVLGVARDDYRRYTTAVARIQVLFMVTVTAVLAGAALVAVALGRPPVATLLLAAVPALVAWQAHELFRRILYTESRVRAACAVDAVGYGGQCVGVTVLWATGALSGVAALLTLAASFTAGAAVGLVLTRRSFARRSAVSLREHWDYAKWLGAATTAYWLSAQVALVLAAVALGTGATGVLKATLVLLGPLNVALLALDTMLPIAFARAFASGGARRVEEGVRLTLRAAGPAVVVYCLLAVALGDLLLGALFGPAYAGRTPLVALLAVYCSLGYVARVLSAALRARRRTADVFAAYAAASVTGLAVGAFGIAWLELEGAALGMVAGALTSCVVLLLAHRNAPEPRLDRIREPLVAGAVDA
jgi:O-antigen/teichoic acid export membrane protein